jgi:hypothetical protein
VRSGKLIKCFAQIIKSAGIIVFAQVLKSAGIIVFAQVLKSAGIIVFAHFFLKSAARPSPGGWRISAIIL